ncbi:ncl [Symbiodinium necroappetens]|uniref:Ncl protein n=1 Tax=Symbiodinium necroappetens TaxID=1628268 RepID=A0A813CPP8_9DINO|nr:ncl [Symbiodinium necroappetens]
MEKPVKKKKKQAKKPAEEEHARQGTSKKAEAKASPGPSDAEVPAKTGKAQKRKGLQSQPDLPASKKAKKQSLKEGHVDAKDSAEASKTKASLIQKKKKRTGGGGDSGAASQKQEAAAGVNLTVFVDGVPYDWSVEKLSDFFRQRCGEVAEVRAPTWQDSGRLRGYAHVVLGSGESKDKALALNGSKVGKQGRYLKIEPAKQPGEGKSASAGTEDLEGKRRLFVKNLPYSATEDDIAKLFVKCGKVVEIRIPHQAGRSKGFAYVEFAKAKGLQAAMLLDPAPSLQGRKLWLDADSGSGPKAGFHHRAEAFQSKFGPAKPSGKTKQGPAMDRQKGASKKLSLF